MATPAASRSSTGSASGRRGWPRCWSGSFSPSRPRSPPAPRRRRLPTCCPQELEDVGFATRRLRGHATGDHLFARPLGRTRGAPCPAGDRACGHGLAARHGAVDMLRGGTTAHFYGPGAYDMKGWLVQLVFALKVLRELELRPSVTPVVLVNSDEEIGSVDSSLHIRRLARGAARAFVLEPPEAPTGSLKTSHKGVEQFEVVVSGRAAHAGSKPERGVSAIPSPRTRSPSCSRSATPSTECDGQRRHDRRRPPGERGRARGDGPRGRSGTHRGEVLARSRARPGAPAGFTRHGHHSEGRFGPAADAPHQAQSRALPARTAARP